MAMMAQEWSINGLSVEFGIDRRTVAKRLQDVPPCRQDDRTSYYLMRDVAALVGSVPESSGALDLNAERARLAKEQADKTAMENAEKRGVLGNMQKLSEHWAREGANVRTRLLSIPTTAAPQIVGLEIAAAKDLLENLINDALTELSGPMPGADAGNGMADEYAPAAEINGEPVVGQRKKTKPGK